MIIIFQKKAKRKAVFLLCFLFLLFFNFQAIFKSAVVMDEPNYLENGRKIWQENYKEIWQGQDWPGRIMRFHPPLTFYTQGFTSAFLTKDTFFEIQLRGARLTMSLFLFLFAYSVFFYIKKITHNEDFALLALFLFCFNPEIITHGSLATIDLTLSFFIFLFVINFYFFLRKKNFKTMLPAALFLGLALLTKYIALFLIPIIFIVFFLYFIFRKRFFLKPFFYLLTMIFLAVFLVNLGYRFYGSFEKPKVFSSKIFKQTEKTPFSAFFAVFPKPYLQGCDYQLLESEKRNYPGHFFMGSYYNNNKGVWHFFLTTFLLKTPISLLLFIAAALILDLKNPRNKLLSLLILFTVFFYWFYLSFLNNLNIGFRYFLLAYPLFFLYIGFVFSVNQKKLFIRKSFLTVFYLLCFWYAWGTLKITPYFYAYANELIGGPKNSWKYWADSTLDWGQGNKIAFSYFEENPQIIVDPKKLIGGKIAVSVNSLNIFHYNDYLWLRKLNKQPIDNIGYTWLIFNITQKDVEKIKKEFN